MGDPLSVAAGVAGLLSLGLQCTEYLYNYYSACRDQHQELARIADQLGALLESLQIIENVVRTGSWRPNEQSIIESVERSITRSEDIIGVLQNETNKFKKEPTDNWKKKAVVIGRLSTYPFRRSTLGKLEDNISDFRDNLSVTLQALQLREHQNTQNDIEAVNFIIKSIQAQSVSADLRLWLAAPDATVDFNTVSAKRHRGTGQWLVQGSAYRAWLQQGNSFLWLYGFAGCGKSVLCSTAIQYALRRQQPGDSAVAFFFFTFNDESKQDASAALRALLLQLCGQVSGLEADLTRLKDSYNHGTPSVPVLLEYLRQAVARCRHVYILLDALDESPADSSQAEVLSMISTIRQWQLPGLHLLVTSRDLPDIRSRLQFPTLSQGVEHIALKNDSIQQDISRFVSFQVDHDPGLQRWGEHREKIKSHLTLHADGVFRWVECQLRPLRQCAQSEKHLEKCLRTLPRSLDETYERMLCSIESREEAQQILSLLCYASRPLSVNEVIEALAVDIDDLECYDPRSRFTGGADDLLRICPGLIEISLESHNSDHIDFEDESGEKVGVQVVRIAHFSVQEYLESDRIKRSRAADFALSGPSQHGRVTKICLLYLGYDDFLQQILSPDLVNQYAFAKYAAKYWYHHYHQADSQLVQKLRERVITLISRQHVKERWIQLHNPEHPRDTNVKYQELDNNLMSATYYAALLGLDRVLVHILSMSRAADVNAQGGVHGSALQAASARGHEKVVQILLENNADINAQGGEIGTALQAASAGGHEKVVQILLDKGADINVQGKYGTALEMALVGRHEKVVQILLDKGADINVQGKYGTALEIALVGGHEKVVQILLDKGADINVQGKYGTALEMALVGGYEKVVKILLDKVADINVQGKYGTALQIVSEYGHKKVMQILLDKGADINAQGKYGTALQRASAFGHEKVVQILLDKGADINAQDEYGTALQRASAFGHEKVVQILLDKGADINAQDEYGTALQRASAFSHEKVVQILLDKGADINVQDEYGTALQRASAFGHEKVVQILLDKGADINAQDEYGTALQRASAFGHEKVVQILLDKGADINAQDEYGTALQRASAFGHEKVVQILLDKGADINAQDEYGTALQRASAFGHEKVVQILLDKGTDINVQDEYSTALQRASAFGHEKVVQILLDKGADINVQGKYGTALEIALVGGHEKVVQILLDKGADINAQDEYGTTLQRASAFGHEKVVQILLDKGADINAQDEYGTALQRASAFGHEKVVQILLDKGADINAQDEYGTALQRASAFGHEKVVQILLDRGADINAQGKYGTALEMALVGGHEKVVQILLDKGADINAQDEYGTALQRASAFGHEKVVQILLDRGADINVQDEYGTALQMASAFGHEKVVQILRAKGADMNI